MADSKSKNAPTEGAKTVFDRLTTERDNYTQRAEKCAQYTIPQLFPKESDDGGTNYETPYNSVGARGVNNLASKLLLALLPAGQPFFRLGLDAESTAAMNQSQDDQMKDSIEYGLSLMEQAILKYMESQAIRPTLFELIKQLIIAGNALLFLPPAEGGMKCYNLRDYVVERDAVGNVLQIVTRDRLARGSLPESLLSMLGDSGSGEADLGAKVDVYTHVYRLQGNEGDGTWESYQEINGEIVTGTEQSFPLNKSPWIPVRFTKKDGESYGRSFVEDYLGDLISLENLSKATVDMSMISAKVLYLVNPASQTNIRALAKADNGAFVKGRVDDVVPMQLNKSLDMQVVAAAIQDITLRVSRAFLLNSSVQRQGERVTAEEIRYMANELEATLGGVYALLSQELQYPLVSCIFNQMQSQGLLPPIGGQGSPVEIEPTIITGVDALGRGQDASNLTQAIGLFAQLGDQIMSTINFSNLAMRIFTAYHIDATGLVKSPEQMQQEQQAMMQQQAAETGMAAEAQMAVDSNKAQAQAQAGGAMKG